VTDWLDWLLCHLFHVSPTTSAASCWKIKCLSNTKVTGYRTFEMLSGCENLSVLLYVSDSRPNREYPKMLWHVLCMLAIQHSNQGCCRRVLECNLNPLSLFFFVWLHGYPLYYRLNYYPSFLKVLDTVYFDGQGKQPCVAWRTYFFLFLTRDFGSSFCKVQT
jgi:hypothetical protein